MTRYYYDCPLIAAYMAKYQRIDFGTEIHSIFNHLCTTDEQEALKRVKFYPKENSFEEFALQTEDVVQDYSDGTDGLLMYVTEFDLVDWTEKYKRTMKILQRNDMPFFMPKVEDQNA